MAVSAIHFDGATGSDCRSGTSDAQTLISRLVRIAPRLISRAYRRSNMQTTQECVRCAWLACAVLDRVGIEAHPLHTVAESMNAEFLRWRSTGIDHPRATIVTNDPDMVLEQGRSEFLTHCLAFVPATCQIVDLNSFSLARPRVGIDVPAAIALTWEGQIAIRKFCWGVLRYEAWPPEAPQPPPFGDIPDWTAAPYWFGPLAKSIAAHLRSHKSCRM